jgi:16S rRNA (cytidine1402-2'-O)-methyltransferase
VAKENDLERAEPSPATPESPSALAPGLYVTATPIGHARDVTLRALDVLKGCDVIAAEDTRVTSKLLAIYGIAKPLVATTTTMRRGSGRV